MVDTKTGDAWVLESQILVGDSSHPLSCEKDYCGPNSVRYNWVPTVVLSCYANALSFGRNPDDVKEIDKAALSSWKHKLDRYGKEE